MCSRLFPPFCFPCTKEHFVFIFSLIAGARKILTALNCRRSKKASTCCPASFGASFKALEHLPSFEKHTPAASKKNCFQSFVPSQMKTLAHFILPDSPNYGDCPNKPLGISVTCQVESTGGRGCSLSSQGLAKDLTLAASWKAASLEIESAKANMVGAVQLKYWRAS